MEGSSADATLLRHIFILEGLLLGEAVPDWVTSVVGADSVATMPQMQAHLTSVREELGRRLSADEVERARTDAQEELELFSAAQKPWLERSLEALRAQVSDGGYAPADVVDPDDPMTSRSEACNFQLEGDDYKRQMTEAVLAHGFADPSATGAPSNDDAFLQAEGPWRELDDEAQEAVKKGTYFFSTERWTIKKLDDLHRPRFKNNLGPEREWEAYTIAKLHQLDQLVPPPAVAKEFARRLAVVHLRALDAIAAQGAETVTSGHEMPSLVQNVAHLLKYRRCVKLAKLIYRRQGVGSLHDQYEAKLLNKELAHSHQDESESEMGIARRMIRQAHVSNYVQYTYTDPVQKTLSEKTGREKVGFDVGRPRIRNEESKLDYYPEAYYTNPPMAPIMCAAPPRMGKSKLTLLVASFAVKLGGHVEYGVAPDKGIPVDETMRRIQRLKWFEQGLSHHHGRDQSNVAVGSIEVYSEDAPNDLQAMNLRVHKLANDVDRWVLHVRDEAQHVFKVAAKIGTLLSDSLPIFYGLNMCVSATLLPACMVDELLGSLDSVRELLEVKKGGRWAVTRSALEKYAILQRWSFPIGPDFLVPPTEHFFGDDEWIRNQTEQTTRYPPEPSFNQEDDGWYKDIYDGNPLPTKRSTNYYGTWLHVQEYEGVDADGATSARHLESQGDIYLDDCLLPSRLRHAAMMRRSAYMSMEVFSLDAAYKQYLLEFNRRNHKYFDEASGDIVADGRMRIVNQPIQRLTVDAAWMLDHARTWLDDPVWDAMSDSENAIKIHPMLILAPHLHQERRLEWVVVMLKVAWWRMHEDYMKNANGCRNLTSAQLKARYGVVVLMYQANRTEKLFEQIAATRDIGRLTDDTKLVAITFDPTLPENRFPMHVFPNAPGLSPGIMESSVFIPTLTSQHYDFYHQLFDTLTKRVKEGTVAAEHNELFRRVNAFQFLLKGCPAYRAWKTNDPEQEARFVDEDEFPPLVHRLYRFDTANCWMRVQNPVQLLADEDSNSSTGMIIGGGEQDAIMDTLGDNTDGCDTIFWRQDKLRSDPGDQGTAQPGTRDPDASHLQQGGPAAQLDEWVDPGGEYEMPACKAEDGDDVAPPQRLLPNLNAISLRLCVNGYGNAQDAIEEAHAKCGIHKVAAAGYNMFEAGLTIQTTFVDAQTATKHMFVPKYMSFALTQPLPLKSRGDGAQENRELEMTPNLSVLYQLLGRGFVDTKGVSLPADWKLHVLSRKGVRNIVKQYGNAELLLARPKNESIEGRKLALGSLCASIKGAPYDAIKNKWLGKKETSSGTTVDMRRKYNLNYVLSMDVDDYREESDQSLEVGRWPFRKMRECLDGANRPTARADLEDGEEALEEACSAFEAGAVALERHESQINTAGLRFKTV